VALIATDGYTLIAPNLRGPIDQPLTSTRRTGSPKSSACCPATGAFVRSNVLNEIRHNGTPAQWNATRLWRGAAGS